MARLRNTCIVCVCVCVCVCLFVKFDLFFVRVFSRFYVSVVTLYCFSQLAKLWAVGWQRYRSSKVGGQVIFIYVVVAFVVVVVVVVVVAFVVFVVVVVVVVAFVLVSLCIAVHWFSFHPSWL